MGLKAEASAALVFLILYAILFVFLLLGCVTSRIRVTVRSRCGGIIYHCLSCIASNWRRVRHSWQLSDQSTSRILHPVRISKPVVSEIG
jgi:hypothetical protein